MLYSCELNSKKYKKIDTVTFKAYHRGTALKKCYNTVKILKIRTPEVFAVIILKFELFVAFLTFYHTLTDSRASHLSVGENKLPFSETLTKLIL